MENPVANHTTKKDQKHPEPSENVQLDIETVTPDAEKPVVELQKGAENEVKTVEKENPVGAARPGEEPEQSTNGEDSSSAEKDNGIETVTP